MIWMYQDNMVFDDFCLTKMMIWMYQDNRVFDFCLTKMITLGGKEKKNWPCRDCCGVGDRSCGCNFSTDSWKPPLQPQLHNKVDTIIQYVEREAHYNTDINKIKRIRAAPPPLYLKIFSVRLFFFRLS